MKNDKTGETHLKIAAPLTALRLENVQFVTLRVLAVLEIPALDTALPRPVKIEFSTETPIAFKRMTATGVALDELDAYGDENVQSFIDSDDNANLGMADTALIAPA